MTIAAGTRLQAGRWPWIASVALAVAIVAVAAFAVRTLVVAPTASDTPAVVASAPAPTVAQPPAPAAPAGAPSVTDTGGRALPAVVATGVQGLYTALAVGDLPGVEARYAPDRTLDAAPWPQVAPLLADPAAREQLLTALRSDPQRRNGTYRYTVAGGARVGVDAQGRMAFLLLP